MKLKRKTFALLLCVAAMLIFLTAGAIALKPQKASAAGNDLSTQEFLNAFTVAGGAKTFENGELTVQVQKPTAYAQVATETGAGSRWYISSLQTRGTLMLRLKNNTAATQASVQFITRTQKEYGSDKEIFFPLQEGGGYHVYYADLTQCPKATGELRGIRLKLVGAAEGSFSIDHISFERETVADHSVGKVDSCTADGFAVTVTGTLAAGHENAQVDLFRTGIENMNEEIDAAHAFKIGTAQAQGGRFTYSFPFTDGNVSMLSSKFIAAVNGVKFGRAFDIENWRDFTENPYAFTLKNTVLNVLDKGAKGDGITDDTAAIQAAIDEASAAGGGTVVLEGNESAYGRRYVATTVRLKNNVELKIEKGAVLWQSRNESDYRYGYKKGHDAAGITWGHNALTYNYPLVYAADAKNIKLTGGGTVRLCDMGSGAATDAYSEKYGNYCANLVHLVPIGFYNCRNAEVTDITVLRTSCYHMVVYGCENVYLGNLNLTECNCLSGDGISIGAGSKNVIVDRCFIYGNDDAIVLVSHSIGEQRGKTWWHAKPDGGDNRLRNITVRHSAITPGNCIVFVAWGTDASDLTLQAIDGIYVYDNILGARYATAWTGSHAVNVWAGQGAAGNHHYGAAGSTVPVHNVRLLNNSYRGLVSNLGTLDKTNWAADCGGVNVQTAFSDPSFSKKLAAWEYGGEYKQNVSVAEGKAVLALDGALAQTYGVPSIYQGLRLKAGTYIFTAHVEREGGAQVQLFVSDAETGALHAEKTAVNGANTFSFTVEKQGLYLVGARGNAQTGTARLSGFALTGDAEETPPWFDCDFTDGAVPFEMRGWERDESAENAFLTPSENGAHGSLRLAGEYTDFDLKFDYLSQERADGYAALSGWAVEFGSDTQRCRVEYGAQNKRVTLCYVREKERTGALTAEAKYEEIAGAECELPRDGVQVGLRVQNGSVALYLEGERIFKAFAPSVTGSVRVSFFNLAPAVDNFAVGEAESLQFAPSALKAERPAVPPADEGENTKKGCASASYAGGMAVTCVCAAAAVCVLLYRRRKIQR